VSALKNKKNAPGRESANQRATHRKDRLIRLDDLIPKQDVKGGRQLLFGVTDVTQTTPTKKLGCNSGPLPPTPIGHASVTAARDAVIRVCDGAGHERFPLLRYWQSGIEICQSQPAEAT
jgi:hypothetical protein